MSLIQIESLQTPAELDVRAIVRPERHALIFRTFDRLLPGQSFVLVNDHDPKPLRLQLQAEQPGKVDWEYLEQGPQVCRVRIGRALDLATTPLLELIIAYPRLKPVLEEFGLDTCCGSHMTVTEAAADIGIDARPVCEALARELQ